MGIASLILAIVGVEVGDTKLPIWALVMGLVLAAIFTVPLGLVQAITNQQFTLNVLAEIIIGYTLPGRPLAGMVFKSFTYNTTSQAIAFASDLKMGHYMKVPPRLLFLAQVGASIVAVFVSVCVQQWAFNAIPDICTDGQADLFTCPGLLTFGTASLIWSGIGPQRLFSPGTL